MHSKIKKYVMLFCALTFAAMTLTACVAGDEQEKEFISKAQKGDPEAQYQLSRLYFEANGVLQSDKKGEFWVRKAAEQGHMQAQSDLGMMYATGLIVRKNPVEADKWFILTSRQGFGPGTRNMRSLEETMTAQQIEEAKAKADAWTPKDKQ